MNVLNKLFNKPKIKMENKLNLMLVLYAHYTTVTPKDSVRLSKLAIGIDKMTDDLLKDIKVPESTKQPESTKTPDKSQSASPAKVPEAPKAKENNEEKLKAEKERLEKEAAAAAKAAKEKADADAAAAAKAKEDESLVDVYPFYPCTVLPKGGKYPKDIRASAPKAFKAFKDAESAKLTKGTDLYPLVDDLQDIFDELWNMACKGSSGKEILTSAKAILGEYYPELKVDSDWYSKLVNPIMAMVGFIKKNFGYKVDNANVIVTRPSEPKMDLLHDSDCIVSKAVEEKAPELKTVQESTKKTEKPVEKPVDKRKDEEEQESEEEEEVPEIDLGIEEETTIRDTENPPAVNDFDNFTEFETLVFNKILEGAKIASALKDEASKKAVQAENREEVRNLISSNFEGEPWTGKGEDGKWNKKLIDYHNAFITEINKSREKWSKK